MDGDEQLHESSGTDDDDDDVDDSSRTLMMKRIEEWLLDSTIMICIVVYMKVLFCQLFFNKLNVNDE